MKFLFFAIMLALSAQASAKGYQVRISGVVVKGSDSGFGVGSLKGQNYTAVYTLSDLSNAVHSNGGNGYETYYESSNTAVSLTIGNFTQSLNTSYQVYGKSAGIIWLYSLLDDGRLLNHTIFSFDSGSPLLENAEAETNYYIASISGNSFNAGLLPDPSYERVTLDLKPTSISQSVSSVPEPSVWGMMIAGFAIVGGAVRRRARKPHVLNPQLI
jgi:hypothetical protein